MRGQGAPRVGPGQVADLEAILAGLQIDVEDMNILLIEPDDRFVADHIHVRADRRGEEIALGAAEIEPAGIDTRLRRPHRVSDAPATVQGHR